ncbi:hypothetical protein JCM18750_37360 [Halostagnicola bangensis]
MHFDIDELPANISESSALLVAKPSPLEDSLPEIRILDRYASPAECRIAVTTSTSAEKMIQQQTTLTPSLKSGRLGIIDASPTDQPSAPFQEYPVVSLSHPIELTRLVLALWELDKTLSPTSHTAHLTIQSLTPLLTEGDLERTIRGIEQLIDHHQPEPGLVVIGFEYTKHDDTTLSALKELVDGVVWIEETAGGSITAEYRNARNRSGRF